MNTTGPVVRLLAFDHCRTLAPWCAVRSGGTPTLRVRRIAHELEQSGRPSPSAVESALAQVLFLLLSWRQAFLAWRPAHKRVKQHYGIGSIRQFRDLVTLAWHANLPPKVYYFQRLFRQTDPLAALKVIDHRELQLLLRVLHSGIDTMVIEDKLQFHAFCRAHALPTPPILSAYLAGLPVAPSTAKDDWKRDLISKPARSYSSHGIVCWRYDAASDTHSNGTDAYDRAALKAWLVAQSGEHGVILQARLNNAPELHAISPRALANCRVVTARRPDGSLTVLLAALRMGLGDAVTSDDPARSFCAAVDKDSGMLSAAETKQAQEGSYTHHPDSGAPIAQRLLRRWPEMRALALRAHAALPEIKFVGWDLIDTEHDGPMLLEGNLIWGGNLAQMAGNGPLGATEFPEIFIHHAARTTVP